MTIPATSQMLAKEKGIKIIVCIDEFQQLANLPEYKDMEGKNALRYGQSNNSPHCSTAASEI